MTASPGSCGPKNSFMSLKILSNGIMIGNDIIYLQSDNESIKDDKKEKERKVCMCVKENKKIR